MTRPLVGTTPRMLARRGVALDRLAVLTLTRDAFADTPGDDKTLYLGERTQYRASSYVLDQFQRPDDALLGTGYSAPGGGFDVLALDSFLVHATAAGENGLEVYDSEHGRDQWSEVGINTIAANASQAEVGTGVRWDTDGSGYLAVARVTTTTATTRLICYTTGSPSVLDEVDTPWVAGDVLRLEAQFDKLRVYRQGVLILEATDSALTSGTAALAVTIDNGADEAQISFFAAGPLRQEYVGMVADMGDVSASLGLLEPTAQPHSWDVLLVNLAPVGGANNFAELIRHGNNVAVGTFDVHRAHIRVLHAISGGSGPVPVVSGRIHQPESMTASHVRLSCRGLDAYLRPDIQGKTVTYLPGDPGLPPLTTNPCGTVSAPIVVPGSPPTPPDPVTTPVAPGPEVGPPPPDSGGFVEPIPGAYRGLLRIQAGEDISVVDDVSADPAGALEALFQTQNVRVDAQPTFSPFHSWMFFYRSLTDVPGDTLTLQRAGGHWNPNTTATSVGSWVVNVYELAQPADAAEILAYTYTSPPAITGLLASTTCDLPSLGTVNVNIAGVRFFAIQVEDFDQTISGSDESYNGQMAPASIA